MDIARRARRLCPAVAAAEAVLAEQTAPSSLIADEENK